MLPRVAALLLALGICAGVTAGAPAAAPAGASSGASPEASLRASSVLAAGSAADARAPHHDLPGWKLVFVDDFGGHRLGPAWFGYGGLPGGDPAGQFATSHL